MEASHLQSRCSLNEFVSRVCELSVPLTAIFNIESSFELANWSAPARQRRKWRLWKRAVTLICLCMDWVVRTQSAEIWITQCNGLTCIGPSNALLDAVTLLITETPEWQIVWSVPCRQLQTGKLPCFDYVKTKCLEKNVLRQRFQHNFRWIREMRA